MTPRPDDKHPDGQHIEELHQDYLQWSASEPMTHPESVTVEIPVIPLLQRALDEGPTGKLTFLVTERG
jgi:hypothetical protein